MLRRRRPTTDTVHLSGELDVSRENEVRNLVVALAPRPFSTVKLDLGEVTFVDSRGLASIVAALAYLRGRDCKLLLLRPREQLLRFIKLSELTNVLTVDDGDGERPLRLVHGGEEARPG